MQNTKSWRFDSAPKATACPKASIRSGQTGIKILIIGGDVRHHVIDKLTKHPMISTVHWLPTRKGNTEKGPISHAIRKAKPQLVIALYGLMRHKHSEYIRSECNRSSTKLLVRFRGVSPNAIKHELECLKPAKEERA